jgi:3',5'-cyclic AMP phosphodiesterase CpdA
MLKNLVRGLCLILALTGCKPRMAPPVPAAVPADTQPRIVVTAPVIYVTNDVHYLAEGLHDQGARYQQVLDERDGKNVEMVGAILDALQYSFRFEKKEKKEEESTPDIMLFNGDLTYNGERKSHEELAQRLAELEKFGTKVYVIPGNHDINNPWARSFRGDSAYFSDFINPEEFSSI